MTSNMKYCGNNNDDIVLGFLDSRVFDTLKTHVHRFFYFVTELTFMV